MPTLLAAAGEPDIVEKVKKGYQANGKTFKVHLDGYNFLPYFKGEVKKGPREEIFYFGQGGELNAIRWNDWKVHFAVTNGNIATAIREVPGWPVIVNLRADPTKRRRTSPGCTCAGMRTTSGFSCLCSRSSKDSSRHCLNIRSSKVAASTPPESTTTPSRRPKP